jgi:hypothetical protein
MRQGNTGGVVDLQPASFYQSWRYLERSGLRGHARLVEPKAQRATESVRRATKDEAANVPPSKSKFGHGTELNLHGLLD